MQINVNISNRASYTILTLAVIMLVAVGVFAYGGSSPTIIGHSAGELDLNSVNQVVTFKDDVNFDSDIEMRSSDLNLIYGSDLRAQRDVYIQGKLFCDQYVEIDIGVFSWTGWSFNGGASPSSQDTCNGDNNNAYSTTPTSSCLDAKKYTYTSYGQCSTGDDGTCESGDYETNSPVGECCYTLPDGSCPDHVYDASCQRYEKRNWASEDTVKVCVASV